MSKMLLIAIVAAVALQTFGASASSETVVSTTPLTIDANSCAGVEVNMGQKYDYAARLKSLTVQDNCTSVMLSKLYLYDACISTRENNLGVQSYKDLTCDSTTQMDSKTCNAVFSQGPASALVSASNVSAGTQGQPGCGSQCFDSGDICAGKSDTGYFFVQNGCAQPATVNIEVVESGYSGMLCVNIKGHSISGVGIGLIVAASLIAVVALTLICCCCCCRR